MQTGVNGVNGICNINSNLCFGAKIRLKNKKIETLLDFNGKEWAKGILDEFDRFHPDEVVEIDYIQKEFCGELHNWLSAKNLKTNAVFEEIIFPENFEKCNNIQNCNQYYAFLKDMLDIEHGNLKDFWGAENTDFNNVDLKSHKVYIT